MRRPERTRPALLRDLVDWCEEANAFVASRDLAELQRDRTAELALTRLVEVVGEIAGAILRLHAEWCRDRGIDDLVSACRMRSKLAHGYEDVQVPLLFDVADQHVGVLMVQARQWLAELDAPRP